MSADPRRAAEDNPSEASENTGQAFPPRWRAGLKWFGEFVLYLLIAVLVVTLVKVFLITPFLVPSGSMEHTLTKDDRILVWRPGEPERGQMVVFRDDLNWLEPAPPAPAWKNLLAWFKLLPPQDEQYLVKRLIGLPGDHVTCCDVQGRLTVNGKVLDESEYLYYNNAHVAQMPFDIVVPAGRIFVLGDHRDSSEDSRYHTCMAGRPTPEIAFPAIESIQGKVVAVMLPVSRIQSFKIPAVFADVPPPTGTPPSPNTIQWTC